MISMKYVYGIGAVAIAAVAYIFRDNIFPAKPVDHPKGVWGQNHETFADASGNIWSKSDFSDKTIIEYTTRTKKVLDNGWPAGILYMRGSATDSWDKFAIAMNNAASNVPTAEADMRFVV